MSLEAKSARKNHDSRRMRSGRPAQVPRKKKTGMGSPILKSDLLARYPWLTFCDRLCLIRP